MNGWGTVEQVALYVARPKRTIRNWATRGVIPSKIDPVSGRIMVDAIAAARHAETAKRRKGLLLPSS